MIGKAWIILAEAVPEGHPPRPDGVGPRRASGCLPAEYAEQVGELLVKAANDAGDRLGFAMPVDAEYQIGETGASVTDAATYQLVGYSWDHWANKYVSYVTRSKINHVSIRVTPCGDLLDLCLPSEVPDGYLGSYQGRGANEREGCLDQADTIHRVR